LLSKVTDDFCIWNTVTDRYKLDMLCGLSMKASNEGLPISPASLLAPGLRHIERVRLGVH